MTTQLDVELGLTTETVTSRSPVTFNSQPARSLPVKLLVSEMVKPAAILRRRLMRLVVHLAPALRRLLVLRIPLPIAPSLNVLLWMARPSLMQEVQSTVLHAVTMGKVH